MVSSDVCAGGVALGFAAVFGLGAVRRWVLRWALAINRKDNDNATQNNALIYF
jgi:hypothetical protein